MSGPTMLKCAKPTLIGQ